MTDWKTAAHALRLNIPEQDLDRAVAPLAALEATFAQAVTTLAADAEMAVVFDPAQGDAQ